MKAIHIILYFLLLSLPCQAQGVGEAFVELSGTMSGGTFAPLWLSSNRHGIVSPYDNSAYERLGATYAAPIGHATDSARQWRVEAGADIMLAQGAQSRFFVHQAYAALAWQKLRLTIGAREREIDLRDNRLTSGGLSQGINAAPIPEILLNVDYFSVPGTRRWWKIRGRVGYGRTTDGAWQEAWVAPDGGRYNSCILYHEKAMYWRFGREERFPLTFEIGLQMMTQFGGTAYRMEGGDIKLPENLSAYWHALWPMGSEDPTDGVYKNTAGNTVGSYNMAAVWHGRGWQGRAYFERMFEDQSMLTTQYGIYDHLLGLDVALPHNRYVSSVLVEHLSTKDQAGPVYHDTTENIAESYTGRDDYYNHNIYSGWQHWGMSLGTPLLTAPVYNPTHRLYFRNNRLTAWHLGLSGDPVAGLSWRALATFTSNWGTYREPFDDIIRQQHYLAEATLAPRQAQGWRLTLATAYDHGGLMGNSFGATVTIRKTVCLKRSVGCKPTRSR